MFYIFTNRLDEELVLHEHLKKNFFNNSNHSFEGINDGVSKKN